MTHLIALSKDEAFLIASKMMPHDFEYDVEYSKRAGYPIFISEDGSWISDLNTRLEVNVWTNNHAETFNVWIAQKDLRQELINKSREYGYTA